MYIVTKARLVDQTAACSLALEKNLRARENVVRALDGCISMFPYCENGRERLFRHICDGRKKTKTDEACLKLCWARRGDDLEVVRSETTMIRSCVGSSDGMNLARLSSPGH